MTFGLRRPSPRKSLAARLSWRRTLRHSLGLKAPRGWGWRVPMRMSASLTRHHAERGAPLGEALIVMGALTDPRRAAYNRVYNRTTVSWRQLLRRLFG